MLKDIQNISQSMGKWGCYFLCLCYIAEKETNKKIDIFDVLEKSINAKAIFYSKENHDNDQNFFIQNADEILKIATGKKTQTFYSQTKPEKKENQYIIEKWQNGNTAHFKMKDFDPLKESKTVKFGRIQSYRVVKF